MRRRELCSDASRRSSGEVPRVETVGLPQNGWDPPLGCDGGRGDDHNDQGFSCGCVWLETVSPPSFQPGRCKKTNSGPKNTWEDRMLNLSRFAKTLTPSLAPLGVSVALLCADAALAEQTARTGLPQQLCQVHAERARPEAVTPNRPPWERPSADVVRSLDRNLRLRDKDLDLDPPREKADLGARKPHDSPVTRLKKEWDSQSLDSGSYRPPSMQHPLPQTGKGADVIERGTHETHDMAHEKHEEAEPRCHSNAETGRCESYDNK